MAKLKKPAESVQGRYTALPHALLDTTAFMGAPHRARSLLYELIRQHNPEVGSTGKGNNGHLHLSGKWLKLRGWNSKDGIQKAKLELLSRGLIIKTREGGLNNGADKYALTWMAITNFVGLDIQSKDYQPGAYLMLGPFGRAPAKREPGEPPPPPPPTPPPIIRTSPAHTPPSKCHPGARGSAAPHTGAVNAAAAPHTGARTGIFGTPTAPHTGNNVTVTTVPTAGEGCSGVAVAAPEAKPKPSKKRIVGKAGKSGKPKNSHATASETARPAQHINASAYASLRAVDVGVGMSRATRCSVNPAMLGGEA